jgi:integrase
VARGLQQQLASNYVRVVFANLSAILQAAVDDGAIARNPCRAGSVKPPAPDRRKVLPWPAEQVAAVAAALPDRYRAIVAVAAGLGLRQGECFGLAVNDVDFLRGLVHNRHVWKPALEAAGVAAARENGMHAARRYYASALLEDGVSIRAVAEYLGHSDPGFTLCVCAHLMPPSEAKARAAVDRALGGSPVVAQATVQDA